MILTLRRRAALGVAATLGAAALLVGSAPAAYADPVTAAGRAACPAGTFCIFQFANFQGDYRIFGNEARSGYTICDFRRIPSPFDNKASSMVNRTDRHINLYENPGCTGQRYTALPGTEDKSFANNHFDNEASGINFPTRP